MLLLEKGEEMIEEFYYFNVLLLGQPREDQRMFCNENENTVE